MATREEVIAAARLEFPQLKDEADDDIFQAVISEYPEIRKEITVTQETDNTPFMLKGLVPVTKLTQPIAEKIASAIGQKFPSRAGEIAGAALGTIPATIGQLAEEYTSPLNIGLSVAAAGAAPYLSKAAQAARARRALGIDLKGLAAVGPEDVVKTGQVVKGAISGATAGQVAKQTVSLSPEVEAIKTADNIAKAASVAPDNPNAVQAAGEAFKTSLNATEAIVNDFRSKLEAKLIGAEKVTAYTKGGKTVTEILLEGIKDGTIAPDKAALAFGLDPNKAKTVEDVMTAIRQASTGSGQILNRLSQAGKSMLNFIDDPVLKTEFDKLLQNADSVYNANNAYSRGLGKANTLLKTGINYYRGMLVTQIKTSVRNIISQGGNVGVKVFDDAVNGLIRALSGTETPKAAFSNVVEDLLSIGRYMTPDGRKKMGDLLAEIPVMREKLFGNVLSDVTLPNKVIRTANYLNTSQEKFFRNIAFDARLRSDLTRMGVDYNDFWKYVTSAKGNISKEALRIVDDATEHALKMTWAQNPKGDAGKAILNAYDKIPVLYLLGPTYPRFIMNAFKYFTEYNPITGFNSVFKNLGSKNAELGLAELSKPLTGTLLLSAGFALRNSKHAGEKWNQYIPDPDNEPNKVYDLTPFNPFIGYAAMADIITRLTEMKNGERETLGYSNADMVKMMISMRRSDVSGLAAADNFFFNPRDTGVGEKAFDSLTRAIGDFIGGFFTPVVNLRDVVENGNMPSKDVRRAAQIPGGMGEVYNIFPPNLVNPTLEKFPWLRDYLQPSVSPLTGQGRTREDVRLGQFTGIAKKTRNAAELALDNLGISEYQWARRTNNPDFDNAVNTISGTAIAYGLPEQLTEWQLEGIPKNQLHEKTLSFLREVHRESKKLLLESGHAAEIELGFLGKTMPTDPKRLAQIEQIVAQSDYQKLSKSKRNTVISYFLNMWEPE